MHYNSIGFVKGEGFPGPGVLKDSIGFVKGEGFPGPGKYRTTLYFYRIC